MGRLQPTKFRTAVRPLAHALSLTAAMWIAAACVLFGQTDRGSIEGVVKDPNGAVVPAAKVQVVNIETNSKLDYQSDDSGHYIAANLPVGSYRLVVQKEGFRTVAREPIMVSAQTNLAVDVTLQIGAVNDT